MCAFAFVLVAIIIVTAILFYKRKRQHETEKARFKEELLHTQIEIQENTLKNISQEIHDNIGQTLSLARLTLNMMDMEKEASFEQIYHSQELVGKAIQDLRSLSKTLHTDSILAAGLLKAIEFELGLLEKTGAFKTSFTLHGVTSAIDPQKELILFRIIQEAINNIIKHARATQVHVAARFENAVLLLTIQDNGKGIELSNISSEMTSGSGIQNMKNRVVLLGGEFSVKSTLNQGTQIHITIPISNQ